MVYMRVTSRFSVKNGILYKRETVRPLDGAFPYKTFLSTPGLGGGGNCQLHASYVSPCYV